MNREILFRGKRVDNGEWIEGFYAVSGDKTYIIIDNDVAVGYVKMKEVLPETVGQYTGLTDKNGTKIFEGDIIQGTIVSQWSKRKIICHIGWKIDGFVSIDRKNFIHKVKFAKDIEVIGNIYDNPELLEAEE